MATTNKYVTIEQVRETINALAELIVKQDYAPKASLGSLAYKDGIDAENLSDEFKELLDSKADEDTVNDLLDRKIGVTYKPQGSLTGAELLAITPSATNQGYVWNVIDGFTTTDDFVEGKDHTYNSGVNVVVIEIPGEQETDPATYKFDVLAGFIDMSDIANAEAVKELLDQFDEWTLADESDIDEVVAGLVDITGG